MVPSLIGKLLLQTECPTLFALSATTKPKARGAWEQTEPRRPGMIRWRLVLNQATLFSACLPRPSLSTKTSSISSLTRSSVKRSRLVRSDSTPIYIPVCSATRSFTSSTEESKLTVDSGISLGRLIKVATFSSATKCQRTFTGKLCLTPGLQLTWRQLRRSGSLRKPNSVVPSSGCSRSTCLSLLTWPWAVFERLKETNRPESEVVKIGRDWNTLEIFVDTRTFE